MEKTLEEILAEGYTVSIHTSRQLTPCVYVVGLDNKFFGLENTLELALVEAYGKVKEAEALKASRKVSRAKSNPFINPPKV